MCTFVYWKRKEGPSSQWPLHSPCSRPPDVPTEACQPCRLVPSPLSCHFLAVGSRQWQSEQQCLACEPPHHTHTVSCRPHSLGS